MTTESIIQDVRFSLRLFRGSPGFALAAILTLALGIGANTAMFSVLNSLTIARLQVADPDGLFSFSSYNERGIKRYIPMPSVIGLNQEGPFREACGYNGGSNLAIEANGIPMMGVGAFVTGRCFSVFGVMPVLGRALSDEDAPIISPGVKVAVISDRLWNLGFNRDPGALGRTLHVDNAEVTIVGIMPPGFRGINADTGIDIFAPPDTIIPATPGRRPVAQEVLGRLKPGLTFEQASAQLQTMWPALLAEARDATRNAGEGANILGPIVRLDRMGLGLSPTRDNYLQTITLIFGLTTLLLLLACINLGGLLLTRLSARNTELGVRLALGGSRLRIAQQLLIESLLLSAAGTMVAVPLTFSMMPSMSAFIDPGYVGWDRSFAPDLRVLIVTAAIGLIVAVLLTALPAWFALGRESAVRFTWDRTITNASGRWSRGLLVAQVALSVVLLVGAALLTRSLLMILNANPGVRTSGMLYVRLEPIAGGTRGLNPESHYPPLVEKLQAIPGVRGVAMSRAFPRRLSDISTEVALVGDEFGAIRTTADQVSPDFFDVVGMKLLAGRAFTSADNMRSRRVAILSESLARALDADGNVVERHIKFGTLRDMQDILVVGVVSNATLGDLKRTAPMVMFSPAYQTGAFSSPGFSLATDGDAAAIFSAVRQIVRDHGREYVAETTRLDDLLARGPAKERMSAAIAGLVGTIAVVLAVLGIHGVLAYSVARRRRELGIRIAIGAAPLEVAGAVVRDGLVLTACGLAIGLGASFFAVRLLKSLVFGISETDPATFAMAAAFIIVVGGAAAYLPARRAASVDPVIALRAD